MSQLLHRLVETTPPAAEPLDLSDVKTFLRIDHSNDDTLVTGLIVAARQFCENVTGRSLITRSYSLYLDNWPQEGATQGWWDGIREGADGTGSSPALQLPKPPLLSVVRINTYSASNAATEFSSSNYYVDTAGSPGRIVLAAGSPPPVAGRPANGIEVQYTAGYGASASYVPALLRQGMKQVIAHLYEHRGDSADQALLASGAASIFQVYRVVSVA